MKQIDKIVKKIKKEIGEFKPEIALILGSGLSNACPDMKLLKEIDYETVGLPKSTVKGHKDVFTFGEYKGKKIVKLSRFHYYESGDLKKISLPFEVVSRLGVKDIILTTASGGVSDKISTGDLILIKDHISFAPDPLICKADQYFLSLDNAYDEKYREVIKKIATREKIKIKEGVHAQLTGPSYETIAQINMLKALGVDSVSMSTAQDVILSRFYGMKILCFSLICNNAGESVSHEEVLAVSASNAAYLKVLISKFIEDKKINNIF